MLHLSAHKLEVTFHLLKTRGFFLFCSLDHLRRVNHTSLQENITSTSLLFWTMDYFCVFQGKPRPVATWYKDGQPVDPKMVNVRNSNVDSILFIRSAEREHSGKYELVLQIENMEDRASFEIRVIGKVSICRWEHPPLLVYVSVSEDWNLFLLKNWSVLNKSGI